MPCQTGRREGAHLASPPLSSCVRSVGPFLRLMQGKQSEAKPRGYGIVEGAPPRRCWFSFSVKVFIALPSRPPSLRGSPHLNKEVAEQKEERRRRGLETGRGRVASQTLLTPRVDLSHFDFLSLSLFFGGAFYFVARFQEEGGTVGRMVKWGRKEERETMMLCGGKLRKCLSFQPFFACNSEFSIARGKKFNVCLFVCFKQSRATNNYFFCLDGPLEPNLLIENSKQKCRRRRFFF